MATTTDLTTLKINYLTQAQYDAALSGGTINENEIYLTPNVDNGLTWGTATTNSGDVSWTYGISAEGYFVAGFYGSFTPTSISTWNGINYATFASVSYPTALARLISSTHTPTSITATWGTSVCWASTTSHSATGFSVRIFGSGSSGTTSYFRGTIIG